MDDLNEIKEHLTNLVLSGKKEEAIQLLQQKYGTNRTEAEKLLGLAMKESITPGKFFSTVMKNVPDRMSGGRGCKPVIYRFIAVIFGFIGIPFLLISIGVYIYTDYQISHSTIVKGVVTEIRTNHSYDDQASQTPVIEYKYNGETILMYAPVYFDSPEFEVGEELRLFVSEEPPHDVIIDTFTQKWFVVTVVASIGVFFLVFMILFIMLARRDSKST